MRPACRSLAEFCGDGGRDCPERLQYGGRDDGSISRNHEDIEDGITTLDIVCHLVAPRARLASLRVLGQFLMASSATVTIVGRAMMARTRLPASPLSPTGSPNTCWSIGTITIRPKKPYTTDGIPFNSSITGFRKPLTRSEATSDI